MRSVELIAKKRNGAAWTEAELSFFINGYLAGEIPDYQVSAWLMAVYFKGMTLSETVSLTRLMLESGDQLDLSSVPGVTVDKHSTGGVGDKISLILCPLLAASGLIVGKLTGRGLGHTGGTVDKLESIPGFSATLSQEEFYRILNEVGMAMSGAGPSLVPADKQLYALRDVTATVESLPLIASSIMSKKLAGGSTHIVLDVKVGRGAFLKSEAQARELAEIMIHIGNAFGRSVTVVLSQMDEPLGFAVGNALEICETVEVLQGGGPKDVLELTLALGAQLLLSTGKAACESAAREHLQGLLQKGLAWDKFCQFISAQGGDTAVLREPHELLASAARVPVIASSSGYIAAIDALEIGEIAMIAGAGRQRKDEPVDHAAGVLLCKKRNDRVNAGDVLAWVYATEEHRFGQILPRTEAAFLLQQEPAAAPPLVLGVVK